jgi:hypothetical protein
MLSFCITGENKLAWKQEHLYAKVAKAKWNIVNFYAGMIGGWFIKVVPVA